MCTFLLQRYTFCDAVRYVTFMFWKLYVLELLRCVQLRYVTLRHVTFTLCCFTLCSNIFLTPHDILSCKLCVRTGHSCGKDNENCFFCSAVHSCATKVGFVLSTCIYQGNIFLMFLLLYCWSSYYTFSISISSGVDPDPVGQNIAPKSRKKWWNFLKLWDVLFGWLKASPVAWTSFMEAYG